jgi:large subunit ribosomal protein L3
VLSLRVVKLIPEENLVLVEGSVPGGNDQLVVLRGSVKKHGKRWNEVKPLVTGKKKAGGGGH